MAHWKSTKEIFKKLFDDLVCEDTFKSFLFWLLLRYKVSNKDLLKMPEEKILVYYGEYALSNLYALYKKRGLLR